jgi:hypothetical protein
MMKADQEARQPEMVEQILANPNLTEHEWMEPDRARARELLQLLNLIRTPSARNIGLDGSRAVWLIAQHNVDYLNAGAIILKKMKYLYHKDKSDVYYQGIPYLIDRRMIQKNNWAHTNKQLYGTQAYYDNKGVMHGYPIINPKKLAERLKKFDLDIESACIVHG